MTGSGLELRWRLSSFDPTYSLCNVINHHGAVGISVVHWCQRLVSFLTSGIPDLELDGCVFVQGDRLCEESCADCRFSVVIELVLQ